MASKDIKILIKTLADVTGISRVTAAWRKWAADHKVGAAAVTASLRGLAAAAKASFSAFAAAGRAAFNAVSHGMQTVRNAAIGLGVGMGGAVREFYTWNKEAARAWALMDIGKDEFVQMRTEIADMSAELGVAKDELGKGWTLAAGSGVENNEIVRFLRTIDYDQIFSGDPYWATWSDGGFADDGRTLVTRTSFRLLQTLRNLGPAPEPNLTILYTPRLPDGFRRFVSQVAIDTSSLQFENDEIIRRAWGEDSAIACCVSPMALGKQMQFFGARANMGKCLLYAINGGRDEISGQQVAPACAPVQGEVLDFDDVQDRFERMMDWLAGVYVNAMNVIHYMHDKYAYESLQMSLHDTDVGRYMAFGIAGLSVVADSLSAIKHARVGVVRDESGLITEFYSNRDFPAFGNDDDRADGIAVELVQRFLQKLQKHATYRHAEPTLSVLTITSNVVYGKKTGSTPDGRLQGEPFAPGANPMHNRDERGALASLNSVAKIPYACCRDGISCTLTMPPHTLGGSDESRVSNLVSVLDGYFSQRAHHLNVNVLDQEHLREAMEHPELYPNLTVRVSGYAVNFHRLSREQQEEVISRTFHQRL